MEVDSSPYGPSTPTSLRIKVARDEDAFSHIGLDLVDFDRIQPFNVDPDVPICTFKDQIHHVFGIPPQDQFLWMFRYRQNGTLRPAIPLSHQDNKVSVGVLLSEAGNGDVKLYLEVLNRDYPHNLTNEDRMVFFKYYDPKHASLRYVGKLMVKLSWRVSDVYFNLKKLAGLCDTDQIELYEEVLFEPHVVCDMLNQIHTFEFSGIKHGDIICYQKPSTTCVQFAYPSVRSFLQHFHEMKEIENKAHMLEVDNAALSRQLEELKKESDLLKDDKKNSIQMMEAVMQQNAQFILQFSSQFLKVAIENSNCPLMPEDEYGCVRKGIIGSKGVSIKVSRSEALFQLEVRVACEVSHLNVIKFLGTCPEHLTIVYEWNSKGNLEELMASPTNRKCLTWGTRVKIIDDVCHALSCLHNNHPVKLIHGDLRPCNILLDDTYTSKICNFGMSGICLQSSVSKPRMAYLDPEYNSTGEQTSSSDIYSLGVIVLRLLTGLGPLSIAQTVQRALVDNKLQSLIDRSAGKWPSGYTNKLATLGLKCMGCLGPRIHLEDVCKEVDYLVKTSAVAMLLSNMEKDFCCPITHELFKNPQVASDGFTYEKEAIEVWFNRQNDQQDDEQNDQEITSPVTRAVLPDLTLTPNHSLRAALNQFKDLFLTS